MSELSVVLSSMLPSLSPAITETQLHFAPVNIALIKYWGKQDLALNLPVTDSLSISLGQIGTRTKLAISESGQDEMLLNGVVLSSEDRFYQRTTRYLDYFRDTPNRYFRVETGLLLIVYPYH